MSTRAGHAGHMTLAMRAIAHDNGPKVLRIGKIAGGRVIEERVIKDRTHVTVGSGHKNVFLATSAPETMRLFEVVNGSYVLNLTSDTTGRIAGPTGLVDLADARKSGQTRIELTEGSRGKVVLGPPHSEVGFLFQFVSPPPAHAKPQLPLAVSGMGPRVDWGFTIIAAFSFLLHFGLAGAVSSDWFDPSIDDGAETASLIEQASNRAPPPIEEKIAPDDAKTALPKTEAHQPSPGPSKPGPSPTPGPSPDNKGKSDPVALLQKLDQMGLAAVASFDKSAPAQSNLLKTGETAVDASLDKVAEHANGVDASGAKLKIPGGATAPIGPGESSLAGKWNVTKSAPAVAVVDTSAQVKAPGVIAPQKAQGASNVKDVDSVIARNRWRLKACYDKALSLDANAAGTVRVTVRVGEGGEVTSANASSSDAPSGLTQCIGAAFSAMKFSTPEGGSAQFTAPVVLSAPKK